MKVQLLLFLLTLSPGYLSAGDLDEAIRLYERGEFKQAVDVLSQLSRSSPAAPGIRLWLGKSYLKVREWDKAVREMEKAAESEPSNALYHLWLGRACGAKASHTIFFKALGWARRVVKEFETATKLSPENMDVRFDLLDFYINAPGVVGGGKDKAESQAQTIAKLDPRKGYVARAIIFEKNKRLDLAMKELTQATIDHPDDADAHKDLADFYLARKDFENALAYAQRALALDGKSKRAVLIREASKIRSRSGLDEAERILRGLAAGRLRDEDPSLEEVHYWLGECYLAKGDKAKALEAFKSALSFNPEYEPAKDSIAGMR